MTKSASRRFDGHKLDVITDEESELILGVEVRAGTSSASRVFAYDYFVQQWSTWTLPAAVVPGLFTSKSVEPGNRKMPMLV